MSIPVLTIVIIIAMSAASIQKRIANVVTMSEVLKMSSDNIQKPSSYDSIITIITLIDTIGPLIASLHKKTDKNSKDIEEIKSMLKRLTN